MKKLFLLAITLCHAALAQGQTIYRLDANDVAQSNFWTNSNLTNLITPLNASALTINPLLVGIPAVTGQSGKGLSNNGSTLSWADFQPLNSELTTIGTNGSAYYLSRSNHTGTQAWSTLTATPTTLAGYGISDSITAAAAAAAYQPLDADLTTLSSATAAGLALMDDANAAAQRTTLGLGSAAVLGASDDGTAGAAVKYTEGGEIGATNFYTLTTAGYLQGGSIKLVGTTSGVITLSVPAVAGANMINFKAASGDVITTGNLSDINAVGTVTSGTWTGTAIGLGYIAQGGATSGQVLAWNGTTWAPAAGGGGITIGTTPVTGGTASRLLYETAGNVVGEISGATSDGTTLTLVAPVLGTPSSVTLTNATGLPIASGVSGLGTGIATSLTVNVGSAGAPVVNGGALGTPSSGTGTNITGIPPVNVTGTAAILGANTFTALQTITQASANTGILASTGHSLTGANANNMVDLAGTWNTTGAPTALKINITNTASSSSSNLIDLQVDSVSKFAVSSVNNTGWTSGGYTIIAPNYGGSGRMRFGGVGGAFLNPNTELSLGSTTTFGWTAAANGAGNAGQDLILVRKAAATLQLGADAAGVTNQVLTAASRITSDGAGANLTLAGGNGRGDDGGSLIFSYYTTAATATAGTLTEAARINKNGFTIGVGGGAIPAILRATSTEDFDLTADIVDDETVTCVGAVSGDEVVVGVPAGSVTATAQFTGWVSADDTVTIRCRTAIAGENPASGSFSVSVIKR